MFSPAKFWHYPTDPSLPYSTEICFKFCTVVLITELLSWFVKPKNNLVLIFPIRQVTCTNLCDPWPFWFFLAPLILMHSKVLYFLWFPYSTDSTLEQFRLTKEIKYLLKSFSLSVYLKKMDRGSHDKWQRSAISFSVNVLLHWLKNILY